MEDYEDYLEQDLRLKREVIPGILKYLQDEKIPASLAPKVPDLLSRAIESCNWNLLSDSEFKAYPVKIQ